MQFLKMRLSSHVCVFGGKIVILQWFPELHEGFFCLGFGFRVFFSFSGPECNFLSSEFIAVE